VTAGAAGGGDHSEAGVLRHGVGDGGDVAAHHVAHALDDPRPDHAGVGDEQQVPPAGRVNLARQGLDRSGAGKRLHLGLATAPVSSAIRPRQPRHSAA
jgi:hypothetical protein